MQPLMIKTKSLIVGIISLMVTAFTPVIAANAVDYVTVSGSISNPVTGINPTSGKQSGLYTIYVWLSSNPSIRIASAVNITEGAPFSFQIPANTQVQFDVYENEIITPGLSPNLYSGFTAVTQFAQNTSFNIVIPQPYKIKVTVTDYAGVPISGLTADFVDSSNYLWYDQQTLVPAIPGLNWQVDGQHSRAQVAGNQFVIYSYGTNSNGPRQFRIQNSAGSPLWTSAALPVTSDLNLHACISAAGNPNKAPADCALDAIGQELTPVPTSSPTSSATSTSIPVPDTDESDVNAASDAANAAADSATSDASDALAAINSLATTVASNIAMIKSQVSILLGLMSQLKLKS